jgi:hypothetical protein
MRARPVENAMSLEALRLSPFGLFHTVVGLVAVVSGLVALLCHGAILPGSRAGRIYLVTTLVTVLTGFGLFRHGGFGKPHALGVVTLVVLIAAAGAGWRGWFGRAAPYVETIGYSATFFFHWIPGVTETFTRVPVGAPLFADDSAPGLRLVVGVLFALFLAGAALQARRLRARVARAATGGAAVSAR